MHFMLPVCGCLQREKGGNLMWMLVDMGYKNASL